MFSTWSPTDAADSTMLIMMGGQFNLYGFFVLTSCWLNCFSFLVPNLFFFVLQEPSLLSFSIIFPFLVALLGPPQSPHQSLAVWSLEQLALAKVIPSLLTPDWLALGTQIPGSPATGSPATGSPAPESPAPGKVASWLLSLSAVMSFSSLLKST